MKILNMNNMKSTLGLTTYKRAILYLRFSDDKQKGGTSIEVQEKAARTACELAGYKIVDVIKNEAVSADKNKSQRIIDLLETCKKKKGQFDVLMVYKLDRFARSQEQHHWLRSQLLKQNVVLRSATESIDESPTGKFMEGVMAAVAEYDNEIKRERVKASMWTRVEQGLWPWQPPVGYMTVRTIDQKVQPFQIDEKCRSAVESIFRQFASGTVTKTDLANEFGSRTIVNYKGRRIKFTNQTIDNILNNHYYSGILEMNDGRLINGKHKPLIDEPTFNKCQLLQSKSYSQRNAHVHNDDFPLRRFVACSSCSQPMTGGWSTSRNKTKHVYYYCHNSTCQRYSKMIRRSDIELAFSAYLSHIKPTDDFIERFNEVFIKRYKERENEIRGEFTNQTNVIQKLEEERKWIIENGKKGILKDDVLREEINNVEQRLTLAKMELTNTHGEELDINALLEYAYSFIRTIEFAWSEASSPVKVKLQRLVFPKGVTYSLESGYSNQEIAPIFNLISAFGEAQSTVVNCYNEVRTFFKS